MKTYDVTRTAQTTLSLTEKQAVSRPLKPIKITVPEPCKVTTNTNNITIHTFKDLTFKLFPQILCENCPALGNCFGNASRKPFLRRALADNSENLQLRGTDYTLNTLYKAGDNGLNLERNHENISPEKQACISRNGNNYTIDSDPLKNSCNTCPRMDSCNFRTRLFLLAALNHNQPLPNTLSLD